MMVSPPVTVEGTGLEFMRPDELALSLAWHSTFQSRTCTSSGQKSGSDHSGGGTGKLAWEKSVGE